LSQQPPIQPADFDKVDIRVGLVTDAREFPEARRPAYRLWIDFGPLGVKRASAQITRHYRVEQLIGRQIIAVVLVLGAYDAEGAVVLLETERPVAPGSRIG
jgi:tRNA-binding protein